MSPRGTDSGIPRATPPLILIGGRGKTHDSVACRREPHSVRVGYDIQPFRRINDDFASFGQSVPSREPSLWCLPHARLASNDLKWNSGAAPRFNIAFAPIRKTPTYRRLTPTRSRSPTLPRAHCAILRACLQTSDDPPSPHCSAPRERSQSASLRSARAGAWARRRKHLAFRGPPD